MVHASGWPVPLWMLSLPKPSKLKRRKLKKSPVERKSIGIVAGRSVGKGEAVRKHEMIQASKKRKLRDQVERSTSDKSKGIPMDVE
jgi:ATP-dependent RNA helicase DDX52/ROK1